MTELTGKSVLITGASSGIGEATAHVLSQAGASVFLVARREEQLARLATQIGGTGASVAYRACDVAKRQGLQDAAAQAVAAFGGIDILVNNAGTMTPIGHIGQVDPDLWEAAIDTNLKGAFNAIRAVLPPMLVQGTGTIINMSSGAVNSALEGWSHYCASKAGARKLTEIGHKEYADRGITFVGLSPGTVATPIMDEVRASKMNPVSQIDPSEHIPPEWAARAVLYLCGPAGAEHAGTDFSIKTDEGRAAVGLPPVN
ncbi:MAG: SDR family oxidoreductase [Pseudomonadota bacterium]